RKEWLLPNSVAHTELRNTCLSQSFLKTLRNIVNFRHTGSLENVNSDILAYESKRHAYSYEGYKARCQLAVIDHNNHRNRESLWNKEGQVMYYRAYSASS
ncbi:unnamed protein product, partial [Owenia fusiformis]